jgi:hypothetical protein
MAVSLVVKLKKSNTMCRIECSFSKWQLSKIILLRN